MTEEIKGYPNEKIVEEYIRNLSWSGDATDHEKTLVAGNIRGFASALRLISSEAEQWQPIRTAPKDGTTILALLPDSDSCYVIEWVDVEKGIRTEHQSSGKIGWHTAFDGYFFADHEQPTHWMHAPDVPKDHPLYDREC